MKIETSSKCSFCQESIETIVHLFWFCPKVKIFIKEVLSHIKDKYNTVMNISINSWFFLSDMLSVEIIVITVCKYVIHKARLNKSVPSTSFMVSALKMEAQKEYNLYKSKNKLNEFHAKWGTLTQILKENA